MKRILIFLLLLCASCYIKAQTFPNVDSVKKYINDSIVSNRTLKASSLQKAYNGIAKFLPEMKDTGSVTNKAHGKYTFQISDSTLYVYDTIGTKRWRKASAGSAGGSYWGGILGSISAQTDLISALAGKLNNTDTVGKWLTSTRKSHDSVFYQIGGSWVFSHKDSTGAGSSYTFTQGIKETGGVVKIDNLREISYLVKQTSGSSLAPGYLAVGTPTYSVSGGNWLFNSNGNNYTQYVRADTGVLSDKCYIEVTFTLNSIVSSSEGAKLMFKSFNPYTGGLYQHDVAFGYMTGASSSNYGKCFIYGKTGASYTYSDSARYSSATDVIRLRLERHGLSYIGTASNLTKGWHLQVTVNCTPAGSPFVPHNASYPAFVPGQDNLTVTDWRYTIKAPLYTKYIIAGNSIMMGQGASNEASGGARSVGDYSQNIVMGGGADGTAELLKCLGEIMAIKPEKLILGEFAGNDVLFGVSSTVWKFNINRLYTEPIAAGIPVIITLPTPRTATDESALRDYIDTSSVFRQGMKIRNTWYDLANTGLTTLKTEYNADGTHPKDAGHFAWAAAVNRDLHVANSSAGFYVNKNLYVLNGTVTAVDRGTGSDQFDVGAFIAKKLNGTNSFQMGVDASGNAYLQAYTPGSSYDDIRLNPAGDPRIIVGASGITGYKLNVRNTTSGTSNLLALIHGGSFSANDQESRIGFFNITTAVGYHSSYLHSSSKFGHRFWTYDGSQINAVPGLTVSGDNKAGVNIADPLNTFDINGDLRIRTIANGSTPDSFLVKETGIVKYRTLAQLTTDVGIAAGTFTPTLFNTANIDSSRAYVTNYSKSGNTYTVWGICKVDATASATITELGMSLPLASGITTVQDLSGMAVFEDGSVFQIKGDISNGRAMFRGKPLSNTDNTFSFYLTFKWVAP